MANCRGDLTGKSYTEPGCEIEGSRIVAIAFVEKDHTLTDPSSPTEWLNADYDSDVLIFKEVRGAKPKGSPTEIPGTGSQSTRVTGRDYESSIMVPGVLDNRDFLNELNKSTNYRFAYVTGGDYQTTGKDNSVLHITDVTVSIDFDTEITENLGDQLLWSGAVKWSDLNIPKVYTVPAGVFE